MNPVRNDPCPCGSEKKFKACCGSLQNKEAAAQTRPLNAAMQETFQRARELHCARRLSEAEAIYRRILEDEPEHADSLDFLGVIACQTGRNEPAVELINRAININPSSSVYHSHLGNVLMEQGNLEEAIASFRKAIALKPDYAEVHNNLGNALVNQGKPEEAIASFRKAIALKPELIAAHNNLGRMFAYKGQLNDAINSFHNALKYKPDMLEAHLNLANTLKMQGKLDEAIESFHRVLALKPDNANAHNGIGNILLEQGKLDEAIASYQKAIALKPDFAELHSNLGSAFKEQGKLDAAVESYRRAIELKPDLPGVCNNLGNTLIEQGELEAAIACYRQALKLQPDSAEAYNGLGNALKVQGNLDAASESFNKALALKSDNALAHFGLAGIHQHNGQFAAAKTHLDQALALEPDNPVVWADLVSLRKVTPDDLHWAEKAQQLLEGGPKPQEEMRLCYALGKYYDDIRQYETAFGYYERANCLKQKLVGHFDRDNFRRIVDAIIFAHPLEIVRQQQAGSSTSRRPLFIVGMPRSGTSLTEQILASHPDAFGAGELHFWRKQAQAHLSEMPSGDHQGTRLQDIAKQCETELLSHSATALRVVDKMPGNFLYLGLIHAVFPQARILHTRRNPIDTCLSIYFQDFNNQHKYANNLEDLAFYYREYRRLMAHWRAVLPPEVFLDVPYEALVEDQEGWSRRIIEFIGLPWNECCLNFHETERKVGTASNWQVRQKIYKTSKERWRNYEQFVGPLLDALGDLVPARQ